MVEDGLPASTVSAGEWQELIARSGGHPFFSSPEWLFASPYPQHVVSVHRDGRLTAVLPLVIDGDVARFPTRLTDYNDVIAETPEDALEAVAIARSGPYEALELTGLRSDSKLLAAMPDAEVTSTRTTSYADLTGGRAEYLADRGRNFRRNVRKATRRAALQGYEVRELTPDNVSPPSLPPAFLDLHLRRCPRSVFAQPEIAAIAREVLPRLFADRSLRVFAAMHGERIAALDLCAAGPDGLAVWNGAIDDADAHISPGRLVMDAAITAACDEGLREYDLLRGEQPYKLAWRTGVREVVAVRVPTFACAATPTAHCRPGP
jgi:CelD/BcsL family acetyltransferase involved in cellulose biosynthesis